MKPNIQKDLTSLQALAAMGRGRKIEVCFAGTDDYVPVVAAADTDEGFLVYIAQDGERLEMRVWDVDSIREVR